MGDKSLKTDPRNVAIIILAVVSMCALVLAAWALAGLGQAGSISEFAPEEVSEEEKLTDRIALPQFAWLNLKAGSKEQSLTFDNPSINYAYFRVSLVMDGETLWESELLAPGKTSKPVELSKPLAAGEYDVTLCYSCFSDKREKNALNGAASPMKLKVE